MCIPSIGIDFCVHLCLSLWYGFCHALPVILVCLFSVLRFSTEILARVVVWPYLYPRDTNDIRFWPKFRPAYRNCISSQWFNMQSSACRIFGQVIGFSRHAVHLSTFLAEL